LCLRGGGEQSEGEEEFHCFSRIDAVCWGKVLAMGAQSDLWLKGAGGLAGVSGVAGPSTARRSAQDDEFVGV